MIPGMMTTGIVKSINLEASGYGLCSMSEPLSPPLSLFNISSTGAHDLLAALRPTLPLYTRVSFLEFSSFLASLFVGFLFFLGASGE